MARILVEWGRRDVARACDYVEGSVFAEVITGWSEFRSAMVEAQQWFGAEGVVPTVLDPSHLDGSEFFIRVGLGARSA